MDDLIDDIRRDAHDFFVRDTIKRTQKTMQQLERKISNMQPAQRNIFTDRERTVAKAADNLVDGPKIMSAASASPAVNVKTMGVISSLCHANQFAKAREVYHEAVQKHVLAKAPDAADKAMSTVSTPAPAVDLGAIVDTVKRMEQTLATITTRLSRLEARQSTAPLNQVIAKGTSAKRPRTAEALHTLLDAYVDDPTQTGAISSLIAAGQLAEAEQMLLAAKRAHDSEKARRERRSWAQ